MKTIICTECGRGIETELEAPEDICGRCFNDLYGYEDEDEEE